MCVGPWRRAGRPHLQVQRPNDGAALQPSAGFAAGSESCLELGFALEMSVVGGAASSNRLFSSWLWRLRHCPVSSWVRAWLVSAMIDSYV